MNQQKIFYPELFTILSDGAAKLGVPVHEQALSKMITYIDILKLWNKKFNLTAIVDPLRIAVVHFLDSLTILKVFHDTQGKSVLDIGSGAGFPGMVLKIADESIQLTLLDKNPKRILFLKEVARELDLSSIIFLNRSLQDLEKNEISRLFDIVTFRALPKKSMRFINLKRILAPTGSVVRMYSESEGKSEPIFSFLVEVSRWNGFLPYYDLKRTVVRYSLANGD